jgi:hypothetical protein
MPAAFSMGSHFCGLLPAVSTALTPPSMMAHVAGVVGRLDGGQKREVHAEGLVGHLAAARDLARQQLGRALRQAGDDAQPAGVGDGRGQLGKADEVHAALDDGVLDAEQFGDAGLHGPSSAARTSRMSCR